LIAIAIYTPSSPQRLVDCARIVYSSGIIDTLIVVKPVGMAAQVGLAEISKIAYKAGKKLVILSQLDEVREVLNVDEVLYLVHDETVQDVATTIKGLGLDKRLCIVVQGGEATIPRQELAKGIPVRHRLPMMAPVPSADVALVIVELMELMRSEGSIFASGSQQPQGFE